MSRKIPNKSLKDFLLTIERLNNSPDLVSKTLTENNIDEEELANKANDLTNKLIQGLVQESTALSPELPPPSIFKHEQDLLNKLAAYNSRQLGGKSIEQKLIDLEKFVLKGKSEYEDVWRIFQQVKDGFEIVTQWEALFTDHFQVDVIPEERPLSFEEAFDYYSLGEYKEAIKAFDDIDMENLVVTRGGEQNKDLAIFYASYYKGLSYMAEGSYDEENFKKATIELQNAIEQSPDSVLQLKAKWYLALSYLKTNNVEKAVELLRQVAQNEEVDEYKQNALEMISMLYKT